jgi:hypothetical protein
VQMARLNGFMSRRILLPISKIQMFVIKNLFKSKLNRS